MHEKKRASREDNFFLKDPVKAYCALASRNAKLEELRNPDQSQDLALSSRDKGDENVVVPVSV